MPASAANSNTNTLNKVTNDKGEREIERKEL